MISMLARLPGARRLLTRIPNLPVSVRAEFDLWWNAPSYGFGVQTAANLATALNVPRISAMEWGVVQGDNLVQLERIAKVVASHYRIGVDVAAFDTGKGLPPPLDYRDCPHIWGEGFYTMDVDRVRSRISSANLLLGNIGASISSYLDQPDVAPVGFVACNLDYYSLASEALEALSSARCEMRLPRVLMLFDDVLFPERAGGHNDWTGERLAIREFNAKHPLMKIVPFAGLRWMRQSPAYWHEMVYVLHDFAHPQYGTLITPKGYQYQQM